MLLTWTHGETALEEGMEKCSPDLMIRGSRLWVTAMPLPIQAPHCMLTAAQPAGCFYEGCRIMRCHDQQLLLSS